VSGINHTKKKASFKKQKPVRAGTGFSKPATRPNTLKRKSADQYHITVMFLKKESDPSLTARAWQPDEGSTQHN